LFHKGSSICLKKLLVITLLLLICSSIFAQYYMRGEIKDETGTPLPNAKIFLHSNNLLYYAGSSGGFGIPGRIEVDSMTFSYDGFESKSMKIFSKNFTVVVLKKLNTGNSVQRMRLLSLTKDLREHDRRNWSLSGESYNSIVENEFIPARKYPLTGFSLNIDKASYSNIRRFLTMKTQVPPDAVRIEEMLNYFDFGYTAPGKDSVFHIQSQLSACPWNTENQLLFLNISTKKINIETVAPSNLVFLIDVSGSMDLTNRLPLLKSAFKLLVKNLRDKDTISIVVYGGTVGVMLPPTSGANKQKILDVIEELEPGGNTPGESGIRSAYRLAKSQFIKGGNNRVILATDGDFNVGQTTDKDLDDLISQHRETGIYLTCLGVGMGNYKDSKLETLAKKGNGNFAYLDNEREAEKVLVKELTQTLYTVADNVFLNIQFNADYVREYRLIGFDNKLNAIADSTSELEGGELGSGHTLMAIFELKPAHEHTDPVYRMPAADKIAAISLSYKLPNDKKEKSSLFSYTCPMNYVDFNELDAHYRFATAIVMFGSLLRLSEQTKTLNWNDVVDVATKASKPGDVLQTEFIEMVQMARKIYSKKRKKGEE
jgi:Ca-activated chloride channel homolog